jgi:hypothetical protein
LFLYLKTSVLRHPDNLLAEFRLIYFYGYAAGAANQKVALVLGSRRGAANKGIE